MTNEYFPRFDKDTCFIAIFLIEYQFVCIFYRKFIMNIRNQFPFLRDMKLFLNSHCNYYIRTISVDKKRYVSKISEY